MNRTARIAIATTLAAGALAPDALAAGFKPEAIVDTSAAAPVCGPAELCVGYVTPAGKEVFFNAAHSKPGFNASIKKVEMDLNGNGVYDFTTTNRLQSGRWTYQAPARNLSVKVRVTNSLGLTDETAVRLRVNTPPAPAFAVPATVTAGVPFELDASTTADDQTGLSYAWDPEGDGTYGLASTTPKTTLTLPAGTRRIGLKVVDRQGLEATTTRDVVVTAPPAPVTPTTPTSPTPTPTPADPSPTPQPQPAPASTVALSGSAKLAGKRARVRLVCSAGTTRCAGDLKLAAGGARAYDLAAGETRTVTVRLAKPARKRIKRAGAITTLATFDGASARLQIVR